VSICPWYITAHAVRRWLEITSRPAGEAHFEDARIELVQLAADTWARYERERPDGSAPEPKLTRTGAYSYRSAYTRVKGQRTQVDLIVSMERRPEGPKPQLVDIHWGGERRRPQ
jgi:hypothetical protein